MVEHDMDEFERTLDEKDEVIYKPLLGSGKGYYIFVSILISIVGLGIYAYYYQLQHGLAVTGMNDDMIWGLYMTNFIFFIGISHAGTLISAILRVTKAEWRIPITRMAEAITVFALITAVPMVIIDLGRPDNIGNMLLHGRFQSPLLWDMVSISTYLIGSLLFLYLPLIPDVAKARDKLVNKIPKWKMKLYNLLSLGWKGTKSQKHLLEKGMAIMAILIIPIAISVHTVVAWVYSMTLRVGWHSTIFGPYFVVGAIFSGIAGIIVALAIFRKVYHLEGFIKLKHFKNLGYLLLVMDIAYIYFMLSEYLTISYHPLSDEAVLLESFFGGQYMFMFMFMTIGCFIIPGIILAIPKTFTVTGSVIASILIIIGMWIKRYIIILGTLSVPLIGDEVASYAPTWVEIAITAAAFAGFILFYTVFSKVFPLVSIWEVREVAVRDEKVRFQLEHGTRVKLTKCPICKADVFDEVNCPACNEPLEKWRDRRPTPKVKKPTLVKGTEENVKGTYTGGSS